MKKRDFDHAMSELQRHLPLQAPRCGLPDTEWRVFPHPLSVVIEGEMQPEEIGLISVCTMVAQQGYAVVASAHAVLENPALQAWRAARVVSWMELEHRVMALPSVPMEPV